MSSIERVTDANLNRLSEGLRVLEDICRFVLDDQDLSEDIKKFRHELCKLSSTIILKHRNSEHDVGKDISTNEEFERVDLLAITKANVKRAQQALRVLEEMSKTTNVLEAQVFKKMRYDCYEIEKRMVQKLLVFCKPKLPCSLLYLILTPETCLNRNPLDVAEQALKGGVQVVQLRSKSLTDKKLFELGSKIKSLCFKHKAIFLINDRVDVALALDVHGVHIGQDDLSIDVVRKLLRPYQIIGLSCHNREQLMGDEAKLADYLAIGPVFKTATKERTWPVLGVDPLVMMKDIKKPVVAIGGICSHNIDQIVRAGCQRVAVISAITQAENVLEQTKLLIQKIKGENHYANPT